MPIPTNFDRRLSAIDDAHSLIIIKLRTMQFGGAPRDARAQLRIVLQGYADQVMAAATEDNMKQIVSGSETKNSTLDGQ